MVKRRVVHGWCLSRSEPEQKAARRSPLRFHYQTDRHRSPAAFSDLSQPFNDLPPSLMESRPSTSSVSKTPGFVTASASASIHSRLSVSSSSSQRRLRVPVRDNSTEEIPLVEKPKSPSQPADPQSAPTSPEIPDLPLFNPAAKPSSRASSFWAKLYWVFALYCVISVVLFTSRLIRLHSLFGNEFGDYAGERGISPVDEFSDSYRMARLLQMEPSLVNFAPFVFRARKHFKETAITACLWIEKDALKDLEHWATYWDGK